MLFSLDIKDKRHAEEGPTDPNEIARSTDLQFASDQVEAFAQRLGLGRVVATSAQRDVAMADIMTDTGMIEQKATVVAKGFTPGSVVMNNVVEYSGVQG